MKMKRIHRIEIARKQQKQENERLRKLKAEKPKGSK